MTITQEFRESVNNKDTRMVRIMLKDSLVVDPTFREFNEISLIAESNVEDLYDEHNGEILKYEISTWTKDYMDEQMVQVVYNFSKERINLLKSICKHIYRERAIKIESNRKNSEFKTTITKRQAGTGLAIGGALVVVAGVVIETPVIIAAGVTVGIVGGILITTDK